MWFQYFFRAENFFTCRTLTLVLGSFGMMPASGKLRDAEIIKRRFIFSGSFAIANVIMFVKTAWWILHLSARYSMIATDWVSTRPSISRHGTFIKQCLLSFWLRIKVNMVSMIINHSMTTIKQSSQTSIVTGRITRTYQTVMHSRWFVVERVCPQCLLTRNTWVGMG